MYITYQSWQPAEGEWVSKRSCYREGSPYENIFFRVKFASSDTKTYFDAPPTNILSINQEVIDQWRRKRCELMQKLFIDEPSND